MTSDNPRPIARIRTSPSSGLYTPRFSTAVGFGKRLVATARRLGLALFIITACKVLLDVGNLGQLYRIVSFTVFGVVALAASFAYVRYKDRLKTIV